MSQFSYDMAVAYRIYPKISTSSNPPPVFSDDKLKLSEFCLNSFKKSLGGLKVKMWVFLNGCPPAYEELFTRLWAPEDLVLVRYPGVGPRVTLLEATRTLMDQTDAKIVYFTDDDYFYLPGQFELAVDFLKQNPDADFVTPYENFDYYTADLNKLPYAIKKFGGKEWNSCVSTTHTFLATRAALVEARRFIVGLFERFPGTDNPPDLGMWMPLTKKRIFNPVKFFRWLIPHRFWSGSILIAWFYGWRQILFGRRYTLWAPHTSIATHMVSGLESPYIDWPKEFQKQTPAVGPQAQND